MISRIPHRVVSPTFALCATIAAFACGPDAADPVPIDAAERYAEAICESHERCGCTGEWFDDAGQCDTAAREQFELIAAWPGVEFDKQCFEDVLKYLAADECRPIFDEEWQSVPCLIFKGTLRSGDACTPIGALPRLASAGGGALVDDTCAAPGVCVAGRCHSGLIPAVGFGESCTLETGARCNSQDLYCAADGTCQQRRAVGEACDTPYACADYGHYCAGLTETGDSGVCSARIAEGGSCEPAEWASCENTPGVYCDESGACRGVWPGVCQLLAETPDFFKLVDWVPLR